MNNYLSWGHQLRELINMDNSKNTPKKIFWVLLIFVVFSIVGSFSFGFFLGAIPNNTQPTSTFNFSSLISSIERYIEDDTIDPALFTEVWEAISAKYVDQPVSQKTLFYGALAGLVDSLGDPYSSYLDPDETVVFNQELNGTFEGIGTEIGIKNNLLTIIAPLPDTPAARAGLKAGDSILKIDDEETIDLRIDQAVRLIRGPKGSVVVLTVVSKGENEAREVSIVREVIKIDSVSWEMLDNNIAYIEIVHFDSNTDENFKKIANEIIVANPDGLIIDVRNNPGGFLDSVVAIAGVLLKEEVIVIEASGNERSEIKSTTSPKLGEIEIVVLVNGGSASASEILAGALQDYDRAIILGEQTFGKGSVQDFEEFRDGSSLKLTVSKWLTPKGRSINEDGITPDIEVPFTDEDYNNDLDPQLDAAVALILE